MSVDNRLPSSMGSTKPEKSGDIESNNLPYFGLSRFDTRNSSVEKNSYEDSEIHKKPYDPEGILEGQPVLECIFCYKYETAIEFDMELHLHEKHRPELLTEYPLIGKGYTMDIRIRYFVNRIKLREKFKQLETIQTVQSQP
jgi:hypothetical protein